MGSKGSVVASEFLLEKVPSKLFRLDFFSLAENALGGADLAGDGTPPSGLEGLDPIWDEGREGGLEGGPSYSSEAGAKMARSMESFRLGLVCVGSGTIELEGKAERGVRCAEGERWYLLSRLTGRSPAESERVVRWGRSMSSAEPAHWTIRHHESRPGEGRYIHE